MKNKRFISKQLIRGFTLIEILIALVILSIALTAIIKATSQNIKDTFYIQQKTIATWVGLNAINEARLQLTKLPIEEEKQALGAMWLVKGDLVETPNPRIKEIHVSVFRKNDEAQLIELQSYLYAQS
jgi:general secretion pathway protein I